MCTRCILWLFFVAAVVMAATTEARAAGFQQHSNIQRANYRRGCIYARVRLQCRSRNLSREDAAGRARAFRMLILKVGIGCSCGIFCPL